MANCTPKSGGQFELESGGQFAPKLVVNLDWKVVVNLTGFSTLLQKMQILVTLILELIVLRVVNLFKVK
jgi:hypothetical protein